VGTNNDRFVRSTGYRHDNGLLVVVIASRFDRGFTLCGLRRDLIQRLQKPSPRLQAIGSVRRFEASVREFGERLDIVPDTYRGGQLNW
jgi:hypothetical protein